MRFLRGDKLRGTKLLQGLLLMALGAGIAAGVLLWAPWDKGNDSADAVSEAFCDESSEWHAAMDPFFRRVNESGSRSGDGLSETRELFMEAAAKPIPVAHSEDEEEIRTVMLDTVRVHEAWLSELSIVDEIDEARDRLERSGRELYSEVREEWIRARRESEARRIEGNDLLRQTNSLLGDACGLAPLEIYSP